ncbi:MAG: polysaccharide deacetylase family protein [Cyclobacteriaceae bacterium]|nr:polysaccharide deacetylase family protein [Cyclobacteriaceae bacterium]
MKASVALVAVLWVFASCSGKSGLTGTTEIATWQGGKKGAVSITFDDGSINQFRQAIPILNRLGFKGTFFIITGNIPGSEFRGTFIGRPLEDLVAESAVMPTNDGNFFERASAVGFLGIPGAVELHTQAGTLFEQGKKEEAYAVIDEGFAAARMKTVRIEERQTPEGGITWPAIFEFARQGHEFGNHTVTHPRLAVLDEANLLYELEKAKEELLRHLGSYHTFSAECPYGTENERVMEYALRIHPALRNRMPEPFLEELNRWNDMDPGASAKPYVQWQRGPLADTPMELMKSWIDRVVQNNNVWLVLVFHGVDGVGWEAKPHEELDEYFSYMKDHEDRLWVDTFGNVTRYMRERMYGKVESEVKSDAITVTLTHGLDREMYSLPLTLKTYIDDDWDTVLVRQGAEEKTLTPDKDARGSYVQYQAIPNGGPIAISAR